MINKWKILAIKHNGVKGERGKNVTDLKYDRLVDSIVIFDLEYVEVGRTFTFIFDSFHPRYDWWTVSVVERFDLNEDDGILEVETMNSIYYFELIDAVREDEL